MISGTKLSLNVLLELLHYNDAPEFESCVYKYDERKVY